MNGAELQARRKALGLSRAGLARSLDVDPCTVWRWETDRSRPTKRSLRALNEALAYHEWRRLNQPTMG